MGLWEGQGERCCCPWQSHRCEHRQPRTSQLAARLAHTVPLIAFTQNLILLGGVAVPATGMLGAYALFFVPKS